MHALVQSSTSDRKKERIAGVEREIRPEEDVSSIEGQQQYWRSFHSYIDDGLDAI